MVVQGSNVDEGNLPGKVKQCPFNLLGKVKPCPFKVFQEMFNWLFNVLFIYCVPGSSDTLFRSICLNPWSSACNEFFL